MAERHDEQLLGFATLDKIFPIVDTVDSLDSDISVRPLAARQGKVLREMIEAIKTMKMKIVDELPQTGSNDTIYFILNSDSTEDNNVYDEYVWITSESKYEKLGSFTTNIDLSQYLPRSGGEITGTIYSGSKTGLVNDSEDDLLTAISKFISYEEGYQTGNIATYFTDTFQIFPGIGILILEVKNGYEAYLSAYIKNQMLLANIAQDYSDGNRHIHSIGTVNPGNGYGIAVTDGSPNALFATDGTTTTLKTVNGQSIFGEGNIEINSEGGDVFPEGGEEGQVLTKTSSGTAWQNVPAELPSGGTAGQVLKKTASGTEWADVNDTTYENATQQADGLMSKEDKAKLDNITTAYATILTQEEYNALNPKEENRVYYIKG